jgi:hypothetical protein
MYVYMLVYSGQHEVHIDFHPFGPESYSKYGIILVNDFKNLVL